MSRMENSRGVLRFSAKSPEILREDRRFHSDERKVHFRTVGIKEFVLGP